MASLQLFGRRKCRQTQKAERWLKERRWDYHFIDLDAKPLSPGELDSVARAVGSYNCLIDETSPVFQKKGLKFMDFDAREELLENPGILRTPILRRSPKAVVGFDEISYQEIGRD